MLMMFVIATLVVLLPLITFVVWDFTGATERMAVGDAVSSFAHEAENPASEKLHLTYTGPQDIGTNLIGIGFTASTFNGSARLSVSLNANHRKPWWVLYEEFITDKASGVKVRTERYEAKFRANTKAAAGLETLHKAAAGTLQPPPPSEEAVPVPDPFEMRPDDPQSPPKA